MDTSRDLDIHVDPNTKQPISKAFISDSEEEEGEEGETENFTG